MNTNEEITEELEINKQKSNKKKIMIIGIIFGLVIISIAVFFIIKGQKPMVIAKNLELGEKYLEEGSYEEAKLAFNKIIEIDSKNSKAYENQIKTYLGLKDYENAMAIAEKGLEIIEEKNERVILFEGLLSAYEQGKLEETKIEALKDRAFEDTGDRKFGEKYEKASKDYLNSLAENYAFVSVIPPFDSADTINLDWVFMKFAMGAPVKKIDNIYVRKLSDVELETRKYLNPEIIMPIDRDYDDGRDLKYRDLIGTYDKNTGNILVKEGGYGTPLNTVFSDVIISDFYKRNESYYLSGLPVVLRAQKETRNVQDDIKADVFLDFASTIFSKVGKTGEKIGTATIHPILNENNDVKELEFIYDFDVNSIETPIYEHMLKDNPQGEKSKQAVTGAQGSFYLLSKKAISKDLENIEK